MPEDVERHLDNEGMDDQRAVPRQQMISTDGNCFLRAVLLSVTQNDSMLEEFTMLFNKALTENYDICFPNAETLYPMEIIYGSSKVTVIKSKEEHINLLTSAHSTKIWRGEYEFRVAASLFNIELHIHVMENNAVVSTYIYEPEIKISLWGLYGMVAKRSDIILKSSHFTPVMYIAKVEEPCKVEKREAEEMEDVCWAQFNKKRVKMEAISKHGLINIDDMVQFPPLQMNRKHDSTEEQIRANTDCRDKKHSDSTYNRAENLHYTEKKSLCGGGELNKEDTINEEGQKITVTIPLSRAVINIMSKVQSLGHTKGKGLGQCQLAEITVQKGQEQIFINKIKEMYETQPATRYMMTVDPPISHNGLVDINVTIDNLCLLKEVIMKVRNISIETYRPNISLGESINDSLSNAKFRTHFKGGQQFHINYLCFSINNQDHYVKLHTTKKEKRIELNDTQLRDVFHKGANIVPDNQTTKEIEIKKIISCSKKHFNGNEGEAIRTKEKKETRITKNRAEYKGKQFCLVYENGIGRYCQEYYEDGQELTGMSRTSNDDEVVVRAGYTNLESLLKKQTCFICDENISTMEDMRIKNHFLYGHNMIQMPRVTLTLPNIEKYLYCKGLLCELRKVKYHISIKELYIQHLLVDCSDQIAWETFKQETLITNCPDEEDKNVFNELLGHDEISDNEIDGGDALGAASGDKVNQPSILSIHPGEDTGTSRILSGSSELSDSEYMSDSEDDGEDIIKAVNNNRSGQTCTFSICSNPHIEKDDGKKCHNMTSFCPMKDKFNNITLEKALEENSNHQLGTGCLFENVKHQNISLSSIDDNTCRPVPGKENKEDTELLDVRQRNEIRKLVEDLLMPTGGEPRCKACIKCLVCGEKEMLNINERNKATKIDQDFILRKSISLAVDKNDPTKFKVIATLPIHEEANENMVKNNYKSVLTEFDRKMRKLDTKDKHDLQTEFNKMIQEGYYVDLNDLEKGMKEEILSAPIVNYLSVAPSYKESSLSTKARTAVNGSKKGGKYKKSLNDNQPAGNNELDMSRTFRQFKVQKIAGCGDIKKFYFAIHINKRSLPLQLLLWRKDLEVTNKVQIYCIPRLQYGLTASAKLACLGLQLICSYGESLCPLCEGKESFFNMKQGKLVIKCTDVSHKFSKLVSKSYVDDIIFCSDSVDEFKQLTNYATSLLRKFNYVFKGINHAMESEDNPESPQTLDNRKELLFAGYRYHPSSDCIALRYPYISNGIKERGRYVQNMHLKMVEVHMKGEVPEEATVTVPLTNRELNSNKDLTKTSLETILKYNPKTLRLITSLFSRIYDMLGVTTPLIAQARKCVSIACIESKGNWDDPVSHEIWNLFTEQMEELYQVSLYRYKRIPDKAITKDRKFDIIIQSDCSTSLVITAHAIYDCSDGKRRASLLCARSYLKQSGTSIPRGELQALSLAASLGKTLTEELYEKIDTIQWYTDSKVCIYWLLSPRENVCSFIRARVNNIRNCMSVT